MPTLVFPDGPFEADRRVPGDKSLGHRACMLAGMARGASRVSGLSNGADIRSTQRVLGELGVEFKGDTVESPGIDGWKPPVETLDCGNSGTTMRLMAGALSSSSFESCLVGDASLMRRPMERLVAPLASLGAQIEISDEGTAPVVITGSPLNGADVHIPLPTAQVRTAVALAAIRATGATRITSPPGFRDHTERWLSRLGLAIRHDEVTLVVRPGPIPPLDVSVPGDPSSAAYLWAAAAVRPASAVTTLAVSLNPGRLGFLRILKRMGADITVTERGDVLGDPFGDVTVRYRALDGVEVDEAEMAAAIDEIPLLAVVAVAARGTSRVSGAAELRVKESDRLAASVALARLAGGRARADGDGFVVGDGDADPAPAIATHGDHRIAMSAAVAAIVRRQAVEVAGFEACAVSWPGFLEAMEGLWS